MSAADRPVGNFSEPTGSWSLQVQYSSGSNAPAPADLLHQGVDYRAFLKQIHEALEPTTYLEIGVKAGASLEHARCASVAIDPKLRLRINAVGPRAETHYFQMTSDDFFTKHELRNYFPGGIDLAFLDGMHLFEYLLRDFINSERYAHKNTVVMMHDCHPVSPEIAGRKPTKQREISDAAGGAWAGDVWKLLPILRRYRPDLKMVVLDCWPTGLVLVRDLDPGSRVLKDAYDEIVAAYQNVTLRDYGIDRFRSEFPSVDSRRNFELDSLRRLLAM